MVFRTTYIKHLLNEYSEWVREWIEKKKINKKHSFDSVKRPRDIMIFVVSQMPIFILFLTLLSSLARI